MRTLAAFPIVALMASIACTVPAAADSFRERAEVRFREWLENRVWPDARRLGVSRTVFLRAVEGLRPDWSLPDLAIPGREPEQRQAEFRSPGRYFNENNLAALTRGGRALIREHAGVLERVEARHGVPKEIVVAIWGRESNFGQARLSYDALRSLATEAFIGARKAFFHPELLGILQMLEQGHVERADLKSSWAGALGQPQFLPSKYLRHAVDADGNGHPDIWNSDADSLASIANYLRAEGWQPDAGWGFEIALPADVACTLEGPEKGRPLRDWQRLGVTRKGGGDLLGGTDGGRTAFLLMPAGRMGPAFLVSRNFYVLKQYNESDLYALFIGHLADRFRNGRSRIAGDWETTAGFSRADVTEMQKRLVSGGHDTGGVDGLVGFKTRIAIGLWQERNGLRPTCFPDRDLIRKIVGG